MDTRPPKRPRRSVRSELQSDPSKSSSAPVVLSSRPKSTRTRPSPAPPTRHPSSSPSLSPSKSVGSPNQSKNKSLHSFFQPATEGQRWSSQKFESKRPLPSVSKSLDADDIEDDYDSYDEIFTQHIASQSINSAAKSDSLSSLSHGQRSSLPPKHKAASARRTNQPNKRFLMPPEARDQPRIRSKSPDIIEEVDHRPWAQRYGPANLDELAVHKRKVADVQRWLEDVFTGRCKQKLLVLRGPAGSGKTTTVSLLSRSLGFDVMEWRNPAISDFMAQDYVSVASQFEEFLGRGERFGGLDLQSITGDNDNHRPESHSQEKRILLVEEFPAVLGRNSGLSAFRASIQRYLAAAADHASGILHPPIVMIVSETLLGSVSSTSDNFTVHRLLGPALYNHPSTKIIDFNNVAPTFMQKALRLILEKEARDSKRARVPGPTVLEAISDIGDIRSAVSSLEFLCLKSEQNHKGTWGGTLAKSKSKKPTRETALTSMEEESLKMISQREASLGLFHAVGKIVYNKRLDSSLVPNGTTILPPAPDHLPQNHRAKVSQVEINELADEAGTDITTFVCGLHENYPASCHGTPFVESLNACLEALSDSDILSADRRSAQGARGGTGTSLASLSSSVDRLRQDEISFQVAARGLLFGLPYPVNRKLNADSRGRAGDVHKMLYPSSLRLWRKTEEIEGLVDSSMKQMLDPSGSPYPLSSGNPKITSEATGVKSWRSLRVGHRAAKDAVTETPPTATVTMLSRPDAILYQLPYMAQIYRNGPDAWQLNQITKIHSSRFDNMDEDDSDPFSSWPSQSRPPPGNDAFGSRPPLEEEKLILSDDDIVDD